MPTCCTPRPRENPGRSGGEADEAVYQRTIRPEDAPISDVISMDFARGSGGDRRVTMSRLCVDPVE